MRSKQKRNQWSIQFIITICLCILINIVYTLVHWMGRRSAVNEKWHFNSHFSTLQSTTTHRTRKFRFQFQFVVASLLRGRCAIGFTRQISFRWFALSDNYQSIIKHVRSAMRVWVWAVGPSNFPKFTYTECPITIGDNRHCNVWCGVCTLIMWSHRRSSLFISSKSGSNNSFLPWKIVCLNYTNYDCLYLRHSSSFIRVFVVAIVCVRAR